MFGKQCGFCEILNRIIQGFCKGLDKGTAAGRAGLIELYAVYRMVFDLYALHILTADVQDTVYLWVKEGGSVVMGNCLYFPFIQHQSSFDQSFTVTGGTGPCNMGIFRKPLIDFLDGCDGGAQRISVVVAVEGVQQGSVFSHQSSFCGGGSCVDS